MEDQAVTTRWHRRRQAVHAVEALVCEEPIADPSMGGRARVDAGGGVVATADEVRIARHRRPYQRTFGHLVHDPRRCQLHRAVAGHRGARAEQLDGGVVAAADHWCSRAQATCRGGGASDLAHHRARRDDGRQRGDVPADQVAQLLRPSCGGGVGQQRADGIAEVGAPRAGQLEPEPVLRDEHPSGRGGRGGIVAEDPQQLRQQPGRVHPVQRQLEDARICQAAAARRPRRHCGSRSTGSPVATARRRRR